MPAAGARLIYIAISRHGPLHAKPTLDQAPRQRCRHDRGARAHGSQTASGREANAPEVGLVGTVRTRILAREVESRLTRAAKIAATRPLG